MDCFGTSIQAVVVPALRRLVGTRPNLTVRLYEADIGAAMDRLVRGLAPLSLAGQLVAAAGLQALSCRCWAAARRT